MREPQDQLPDFEGRTCEASTAYLPYCLISFIILRNVVQTSTNFPSVGCSLQDEHSRVQGEVKRLRSDRQSQQDKVQLLLAELRGELLDKSREVEELRLQVKRRPQGFCLDCWLTKKKH